VGPDDHPDLPDQTADDTDQGWGEAGSDQDSRDRWLEDQRPPHHGG
jgi:hypothetical protein